MGDRIWLTIKTKKSKKHKKHPVCPSVGLLGYTSPVRLFAVSAGDTSIYITEAKNIARGVHNITA